MGTAYRTDPVLALIEPEELVEAFLALPDAEQRWRGRLFLAIFWWTHQVAYSWWAALGDDAQTPTEFRAIIEATPDELLVGRTRAARAEIALETGVGLVLA